MRSSNNIILFAILCAISSCQTDLEVGPNEQSHKSNFFLDLRGGSYDKDDLHISIIANGVAFSDEVGAIEILASFFDSSGNRTQADSFFINNEIIEADPSNRGVHRRVYGFNGYTKGDGEDLFGDSLTIQVKEDGNLPEISMKARMPEIINFIIYDHGGELDPDSDLTVTWYPDYKNSDGVTVGIMGYNKIGHAKSYVWDYWETADDGSFTISKSDLQQFKSKSHVKVGIQRAQRLVEVIDGPSDYDVVVLIGSFDGSRPIPIK